MLAEGRLELRRSHWEHPILWLVALLLFSAVVRLAIVFVWLGDGMWSIDGGTYLINRDLVLGIEHDVVMHPRPPLAPGYLLLPFTAALGDDAGLRLFSVAASLLTIPSAYYMSRAFFSPTRSVVVAAIVSWSPWLWESMAAGCIVLLAVSLFMVAVRGLLDWGLGRQGRVSLVLMAAALGIMPWVNQSVTGVALLLLPVVFAVLLWQRLKAGKGFGGLGRLTLALTVACLVAVWSYPYYLSVAPGSDTVAFGGDSLSMLDRLSVTSHVHVWAYATASLLLLWVAYPLRRQAWAVPFMSILAMSVLLMPLDSLDEAVANVLWRARYPSQIAWAVLITGVGLRLRCGWKVALAWCAALALLTVGGLHALANAPLNNIQVISEELEEAVEWMDANAQSEDRLIVDEWSIARYVAPITGSPVTTLMYHSFGYSLETVPSAFRSGNRTAYCVAGWHEYVSGIGDCDGAEEAAATSVRYILANKAVYRYQHPGRRARIDAAWEKTAALPYVELVWQRGDVYVWEVDVGLAAD